MAEALGGGLINIAGWILDPYLVYISSDAVIGQDALLAPSSWRGSALTLGRIVIGRGALIGARSVLSPGVKVGEGAMVMSMSYVTEGTVIPAFEVWGGNPARKIKESEEKVRKAAFFDWRDLIISPLVASGLLCASIWTGIEIAHLFRGSFFSYVLSVYLSLQTFTILFLWFLRAWFPLVEGTHSYRENPGLTYIWKLTSFLTTTFLTLHFGHGLIPASFRTIAFRLLGAKMDLGGGFWPLSFSAYDPSLLVVEKNAIIAKDSILLGHIATTDTLVLSKVRIQREAIVGNRAFIMPGVAMAPFSQVTPLSLVRAGTQIGPGEIWSGIPAKKVGNYVAEQKSKRVEFMSPKDIRTSLFAQAMILCFSISILVLIRSWYWLDLFESLVVFLFANTLVTLGVLWWLRLFMRNQGGEVHSNESPTWFFKWKLYEVLYQNNLFMFLDGTFVPVAFRSLFLKLLGGNVPLGIHVSLAGQVSEPHLFSIGEGSYLSHNSLVQMAVFSESGSLIVGPIKIGKNVYIGLSSFLSPGVVIEDGARVENLSFVLPHTHIRTGEVWAGVPARMLIAVGAGPAPP